jgi:hypothetical protein
VSLRAELAQRRRELAAHAETQRAALAELAAPLARRASAAERAVRITAIVANVVLAARLLLRRRG